MIIVRLSGGLGNQMFQYAFGKSASTKTGQELKFDISFFEKQTHRKLELINCIEAMNVATREEIVNILYPKNIFLRMAAYIFKKTWKHSDNYIREKKSFCFDDSVFKINKSSYFEGYWQNPDYFNDMRNVLLEEFQMKENLDDYSKSVIEKMSQTNSVSIHIRAGDYLNIPEVRDICNGNYYSRAISTVKEKVQNPNFFVFCEDEDYSRKMLPKNIISTFVKTSLNKPHLDMFIMTKCKHNIMANSSFSWWGAWLNQNLSKIIISPKTWHTNSDKNDIVLENWIKI